jgi:hypothetical protein
MALILLAFALVLAVALWASIAAVSAFDATAVPRSCRRQVAWWRTHARLGYYACVALAICAVILAATRG